jgi:hypothetical protein
MTSTTRAMVRTERELNVAHRGSDGGGAVENDLDLDSRRYPG